MMIDANGKRGTSVTLCLSSLMKLWCLVALLPFAAHAFSCPPFLPSSLRTTNNNKKMSSAWSLRDAVNKAIDSTASVDVSTSTNNKKKVSTSTSIKSVLSSRAVACLVAFGVGVRVGAIKSAGATITGRARQSPVAALLLTVLAVREVYRLVPDWAKRRRRNKSAAIQEEDPDDMSSLSTLSFKLQNLFNVASQRLSTPSIPPANMRASLLAILQLFDQVKEQAAQERDDSYDKAGVEVDPKIALSTGHIPQTFEFADWAYDEYPNEDEEATSLEERLATCDYELIRHDKTALPGRVAHYVAVSPKQRTVLIGVKGSSNFEDLLTDCCGLAVKYTLPAPFCSSGTTEIAAHEGIYISSRRLADDLEAIVKHVVLPNGYNIVITGHSLGAGAAAMVGILLRSRFSQLKRDSRLQVLAYASPPILDRDSALACVPFTTTIVNDADVIPRASLHNLAILLEFMKILNDKLEKEGMLPDSFKNVAAFMKFVSEGKGGEMVMSIQEIQEAVEECIEKLDVSDPDFLYVPGRVVHMYNLWSKKDYEEAEKETENQAEDGMDAESDVELNEEMVKTAERVYESNGTSRVLKIFEVDERMVLDHLSEGYRGSIRSLMSS